jgi:hypothetical protein
LSLEIGLAFSSKEACHWGNIPFRDHRRVYFEKRIDVLDAMEKARPCRSSENVPGLPQVAKDAMLLEFLGYAFHNAMKILVLERAS